MRRGIETEAGFASQVISFTERKVARSEDAKYRESLQMISSLYGEIGRFVGENNNLRTQLIEKISAFIARFRVAVSDSDNPKFALQVKQRLISVRNDIPMTYWQDIESIAEEEIQKKEAGAQIIPLKRPLHRSAGEIKHELEDVYKDAEFIRNYFLRLRKYRLEEKKILADTVQEMGNERYNTTKENFWGKILQILDSTSFEETTADFILPVINMAISRGSEASIPFEEIISRLKTKVFGSLALAVRAISPRTLKKSELITFLPDESKIIVPEADDENGASDNQELRGSELIEAAYIMLQKNRLGKYKKRLAHVAGYTPKSKK